MSGRGQERYGWEALVEEIGWALKAMGIFLSR